MIPIVEDANGKVVIRPTATPKRTFSTPIRQISSSTTNDLSRDSLIGIRTFGATSLLKLDPQATGTSGIQDLTYFNSYDVGGTCISDVKVSSDAAPFEILLANNKGAVYGCSLADGRKTM